MDLAARLSELKSGFARTFWVANLLELFERFSFYGSKIVLAVFLAETVGLGPFGVSLVGFYGFAVFCLPILAGPFVDRFGFRKSLAACFAIFSPAKHNSLMEVQSPTTTGVPHACASRIGTPKPSPRLGLSRMSKAA